MFIRQINVLRREEPTGDSWPEEYPAELNQNEGLFSHSASLVEPSAKGHLCPVGPSTILRGL